MNWRQTLAFCFLPLLILMVILVTGQKEEVIVEQYKPERKIASNTYQRRYPAQRKVATRSVSALKNPKIPHHAYKNRVPSSVEETFEKNNAVKVSRGYEFLADVAAIPIDRFNPNLGSVIHKDEHFVYFRTNPDHGFVPVAISKSTKTLYPISSVVHVRGASQTVRDSLVNQGFEQYYYQPALKFLSIQSKSGNVLKLYNDLSKQGLNVQLEVLKPHHHAL